MIYDEQTIIELFERNLDQARVLLDGLEVCSGRKHGFSGLSGWVFERTIQYCIGIELDHLNVAYEIHEQVSLGGRAKADLGIGKTAIEIKTRGLFGRNDIARYEEYRDRAQEKGYHRYVFLTGSESYAPYREGITKALGEDNVVFLKGQIGEWKRFIDIIAEGVKEHSA